MIARKTKSRTSTRIWPYTPEPSPPLEATQITIAVDDDFKMSHEHSTPRPISMVSKKDPSGIFSPHYRPTLDDVLNNRAPSPYTLAAYTAFLSQQHCLETLEFVTEAKNYTTKYEEFTAASEEPLTTESSEGFELMQEWTRIMDVYLKPGAPREINLPAEERDDLIEEPYEPNPPKPEALNPAVQRMRDLMSDSIFIPFCNSVKTVSHASTYNALSNVNRSSTFSDTTPMTYDERNSASRRPQQSRRRSPPASSTFQPSRSPPQTSSRSSALTSALNRPSGGTRLSQNLTNTSRKSESALTDDSGTGEQRASDPESVMSPPLTPPTSDLTQSQSSTSNPSIYSHASKVSRSERNDSGGWKRMGMKIFGNKKKGSYHSDD